MRYKYHVFLSPHADDAILSCGGTISKVANIKGNKVIIYTLFAGNAVLPFSPFAKKIHTLCGNPKDIIGLRRAEDKTAASFLNASIFFTDIPDSLYRRTKSGKLMYCTANSIWGDIHHGDGYLLSYLARYIKKRIRQKQSYIYVPLNIANHVDHKITFKLGQMLRKSGYDIIFYEELPYAIKKKQQRKILKHFTPNISLYEKKHMLLKIKAICYYNSQISMIFKNKNRMRSMLSEYARNISGDNRLYGEFFWKPLQIAVP